MKTNNSHSASQMPLLRRPATGHATKREQKHELLLTFMANTTTQKHKRRTALVKPKLLSTLLSFFL